MLEYTVPILFAARTCTLNVRFIYTCTCIVNPVFCICDIHRVSVTFCLFELTKINVPDFGKTIFKQMSLQFLTHCGLTK